MSATDDEDVAPPPRNEVRQATGRVVLLFGAVALLAAFAAFRSFLAGEVVMGAAASALTAYMAWTARFITRAADEGPLLDGAIQRYFAGKPAAALAALDVLHARRTLTHVRRGASHLRTLIAFRQGDLASTIRNAEATLLGRPALMTRAFEGIHVTEARAWIVLARALLGEAPATDLEAAVRSDPEATAAAIARVELATLVRLDRAQNVEEAARLLQVHRQLFLEELSRSELEILRTIQRKLARRSPSVYRMAGGPETAHDVDASIAEALAEDEADVLGEGTTPEARTLRARSRGHRSALRARATFGEALVKAVGTVAKMTGVFFATLVALGLVIYTIMYATAFVGGEPWSAGRIAIPIVALAGFCLYHAHYLRTQRRQRIVVATARRASSTTRPLDATVLEKVTRSGHPWIAADAILQQARDARRAGRFDRVEALTRVGIARATSTQMGRAAAGHAVTPALLGERAEALAALGREGSALAELAQLETSFPTYPCLPVVRHAVATMLAARAGDLARLAQLGTAARALPTIDHRIALLGDLGRIAVDPEGLGVIEVDRVGRELAQDGALRAWLDGLHPDLTRVLDRGGAGDRARLLALAEQEQEAEAEEASHQAEGIERRRDAATHE